MLDEHARSFGSFCEGYGFFVIEDFPAAPADGKCKIGVFRQRVRRESAGGAHRVSAPGAKGARHHGDAVEQVERALFHVLAGDVFQSLPASDPLGAISHFYVSGHGADARVGEMPYQLRDGVRLDDRVRVNGHNDLAGSQRQRLIERRGLAAVGLMMDAHARIAAKLLVQQRAGGVSGPVIDHRNFDIWII